MPIIHNAQKFGTYRKIAVKAAASGHNAPGVLPVTEGSAGENRSDRKP
jgi:hypothetical protein